MNKNILKTGVQYFISKKWNTDIMSILLKKPIFDGVSQKELVEQLEAKKKCHTKLPTWFNTANIYYPNKLNIEQTSSEITATYKANLVNGKSLIDLTGGFGIDSYFFSKKCDQIHHCEIDKNLSEIGAYNYEILGVNNTTFNSENGLDFLQKNNQKFDWIYIDPSRRNDAKEKVFFMADCLPNVPDNLDFLFSKSNNLLIKTSPLLDFSVGIKEFENVKEIHVVALQNDVKELLWILEKNYTDAITIKTINFAKTGKQIFKFNLDKEKKVVNKFSDPLSYIYEPNSAILKSGAFKTIGNSFELKKLHEHSHLYTSEKLINFPGRRFKILNTIPYSKKEIKKLKISKANITTRNFADSVATIRKKYKIKDGGNQYLFFTTNSENNYIVLDCEKI
ncbi:class I SAM-dependent methyltransferase [Cellulophaga baltica]|uniref:class I SAM-dependent methyltransferase n=1 Tax=Cellulophaga TaxID=104264 RepID=UPI001C070DC9|nr:MULTISPECIES: class I SAM-dependent methyltransferase [Cellulophaga]MBU2996706.1 class I SAM-dependent methyltransferase [Cellulophaga baltica]MDO6768100.1 class I SAM-dependent methyltransferase [Cellulophaga sp. 1_MG-2023]